MASLEGKTAIVTGGSRGIGRHIALALAERGANVAINYRSSKGGADEVTSEIEKLRVKGMAIQADISQMSEARKVVEQTQQEWGRVDILVNNAGITRDKSMKQMTDEDWQAIIDTNLNSVFATCSQVSPIMIDQEYGRIINISSFVGQSGNFGQANYSAAKGGVIAFTKTMALEMAKYDITVNAIAPGFIETEMLEQIPDKIREKLTARVPMRRFGRPEEVAKAVAFLATDGDYITGQQLNVNGGIYM